MSIKAFLPLPADFSSASPIDDSEVVDEDIEGDPETDVDAERGVDDCETEPARARERERVMGESMMDFV